MKIVVIGGTGLIGSKLIARLTEHGHEGVAAAPNTGVNTLTGEGLAEVLVGVDVVVDVSNSPSFADADVLDFWWSPTRASSPRRTTSGAPRRPPRCERHLTRHVAPVSPGSCAARGARARSVVR
ncbi:NAD-dependent epimerase/dehydratase family protein [Nocardioides sp. P5_E3]